MNSLTCSNCGAEKKPGDKFCGNCGAPILVNDVQYSNEIDTSKLKARSRVYRNKASRLDEVLLGIRDFLVNERLEVQTIKSNNTLVLQAKKKVSENKNMAIAQKIYRNALGQDLAISVAFEKYENDLHIKIGATKWIDKAIGGAVFWFVAWPAIIFTG